MSEYIEELEDHLREEVMDHLYALALDHVEKLGRDSVIRVMSEQMGCFLASLQGDCDDRSSEDVIEECVKRFSAAMREVFAAAEE